MRLTTGQSSQIEAAAHHALAAAIGPVAPEAT
jgi:hypothetical protein